MAEDFDTARFAQRLSEAAGLELTRAEALAALLEDYTSSRLATKSDIANVTTHITLLSTGAEKIAEVLSGQIYRVPYVTQEEMRVPLRQLDRSLYTYISQLYTFILIAVAGAICVITALVLWLR
jgi:hypothetical protein